MIKKMQQCAVDSSDSCIPGSISLRGASYESVRVIVVSSHHWVTQEVLNSRELAVPLFQHSLVRPGSLLRYAGGHLEPHAQMLRY